MSLIIILPIIAVVLIVFLIVLHKLKVELAEKSQYLSELNEQVNTQLAKYNELNNSVNLAEQSLVHHQEMSELVQNNTKKLLSTIKEQYALTTESCKTYFNQAKQDYQEEYLQILQDSAENINAKQLEIQASELTLNNLRENYHAIINIKKREAEKQQQQDFYKLIISKAEQEDVNYLKTIIPKLNNQEIINKLIWKTYYEKAYTSLVGRLITNNKQITGIYKITNTVNDMPYIGQAVNVRERFRQHIKRGLKAEPRTSIKLYDAIDKYGIENFTFEILEECTNNRLNEREKYWIDYFQSNSYGYNMTKGGSK